MSIAIVPNAEARMASEGTRNRLSKREISITELEIIVYLKQGSSDEHIAEVLTITPRTLELILNSLIDRLGCTDRSGLVQLVLDVRWPVEPAWSPSPRVSDRELEVIRLVAQGLSNEKIGSELGIALPTVKQHLKRIMAKLEIHSRERLVGIALERGWVKPLPADRAEELSSREQQVIKLVAEGWPNKEIARILQIEPLTVKSHLARIFAKLGVHSRAQMALFVPKPANPSA